jgi:hypothetical protein
VEHLLKKFKAEFPKIPLLPDHELLPVLLTAKAGEPSFLKYVPKGASSATKKALRKWFDKKESPKFKVGRPPDFR